MSKKSESSDIQTESDTDDYQNHDFSVKKFLASTKYFKDLDQPRPSFRGSLLQYQYPPLNDAGLVDIKKFSVRALDMINQADIIIVDNLQILRILIEKKIGNT